MKHLLGVMAAGLALLLGAGFLGRIHPVGDSLAVFRPQVALALFAASGLFWLATRRRRALLPAALALLGPASLAPHVSGPRAAPDLALGLYQKNLSFRLPDPGPVAQDIATSGVGIVTLQEVHSRNRAILDALSSEFPTQVFCPFTGVGGPAVLSRHTARTGSAACLDGAAAVTLDTPCGPVRVISIHLHWPWPYGQEDQVETLLPALASDAPALVAGDFNMVQWSHTLRAIGRATGTRPLNPSRTTLPDKFFGLGLPIDHVLAPERAGTVDFRPLLGSDHRGLVARLPCP